MTLLLNCPPGSSDSLLVVSWNVENLMDWHGDRDDFSPAGSRHWTSSRFHNKCCSIAKTLTLIASSRGRLPDAVALMEVENRYVLQQLLSATMLRRLDYDIVHYDSPDHRGIDCALLYRRSTLNLQWSEARHLYDSCGRVIPTRDILVARFDSLCILVNHHPSKVGSQGSSRREVAMSRMTGICDSLEAAGIGRILCVGDFNDDVWHDGSPGTIKYKGAWEKIDGHFSRGIEKVSEEVFSDPSLIEKDSAFGGMKPRRTYSGPRYLGGISDHLPVVMTLFFNCQEQPASD